MDTYINGIKEIVAKYKPKKGLEVGLHDGNSARAFLEACDGTLISIDWNDRNGALEKVNNPRLSAIFGDSSTVLRELGEKGEKFDYIYIDGDHRYEGCKKDIEAAIPLLAKDGVMVFDDYGVDAGYGQTFDANGTDHNGEYGVKEAVDEMMKGWKEIPTNLANGGKAFVR